MWKEYSRAAISRLLPENQVLYSGEDLFKSQNILSLKEQDVAAYRGTGIATIFQEPMTSLNPVYKVGEQVAEALWVRENRTKTYFETQNVPKPDATSRLFGINTGILGGGRRRLIQLYPKVVELLDKVRIPNPNAVVNMYPHELSGGMKQRKRDQTRRNRELG